MKPWWIAIAVALVIAAAAFFLLRDLGEDRSDRAATTDHRPSADQRHVTSDRRSATNAAPSLPSAGGTIRGVSPEAVRDHRGAARTESSGSLLPPPPVEGGPRMDVAIVTEVSKALRPIVHQCAASIPDAERNDDTAIQVRMTTSISNGAFAVETLTTNVRGAPEHPEVVECIAKQASMITVATGKHADLFDYALTFPYRLRPKS